MKRTFFNSSLLFSILLMIAIFSIPTLSMAAENGPVLPPGATTGQTSGKLPPPGVYLIVGIGANQGRAVGENGKNLPPKLSGIGGGLSLVYVPGLKILGGDFAVAAGQSVRSGRVEIANKTTKSLGFYNTALTPEVLSWYVGHKSYIAERFTVWLPDGRTAFTYNKKTGYSLSPACVAQHYWTFEPSLSYSYIGPKINFTVNNIFDFNTTNVKTAYHTGDIYHLDWTVAHNWGPLGLGVIGTYTRQFTDDTKFGVPVPNGGDSAGSGHRFMRAAVGPLIKYKFKKVTLTAGGLYAFAGKNSGKRSIVAVNLVVPL